MPPLARWLHPPIEKRRTVVRVRGILVPVLAIAVLALAACGGSTTAETTGAATPDEGATTQAPATGDTGVPVVEIETTTTSQSEPATADRYVPARPLPAGFPMFPSAEIWSEIPEAYGGHVYLLNATGTNQEICQFYVAAFHDLGFEVTDEEESGCDLAGFSVEVQKDGQYVVGVTFTSDDPSEVDPGYSLVIDYEVWQDAWLNG
jgi:hypothetical protein